MSSYRTLIDLLAAKPLQPSKLIPRRTTGSLFAASRVPAPPPQNWIWFSSPSSASLPFAGPSPLASAATFNYGGLYAILTPDSSWSPLPYRLLYLGESGKLSDRVRTGHEKYASWARAAGGAGRLYVAFHIIENQTERRATESKLIAHYRPECNDTFNPWSGFYGGR